MKRLKRSIFYGLFPVASFILVHVFYGTPNYRNWWYEGFSRFYHQGIYRYRFLSREAILYLHRWIVEIGRVDFLYSDFKKLEGMYGQYFDLTLYSTFLVYNLTFFVFLLLISYVFFQQYLPTDQLKMTYLALVMVVVLSLYTHMPYDHFSYAFLGLSVLVFHWNDTRSQFLLPIVFLVGTFNRESQCLALAYYLVVVLVEQKQRYRRIRLLISSTGAFLVGYLGTRLYYGFNSALVQEVELIRNFTSPFSLFGLLFAVVSIVSVNQISFDYKSYRPVVLLYLFLLPYFGVLLIGANVREFRLFVPVLILNLYLNSYLQGTNLGPDKDTNTSATAPSTSIG